jgi:hypothetical protein
MTGQAHLALADRQPVDADFAELARLLRLPDKTERP